MRIVSTRSSARRDYTISGDEYFDGLIDFIDAHLSEISLASCDARLFFQKNPERIFYVRAPTPLERSGLYGTGVDVVIIKKSLDEFFLPTPFRLRPTERDFHNTDEFAARLKFRGLSPKATSNLRAKGIVLSSVPKVWAGRSAELIDYDKSASNGDRSRRIARARSSPFVKPKGQSP